jgi:Flp pilus assembly pilin Flp
MVDRRDLRAPRRTGMRRLITAAARGVSMVEYALILVAVILVGAGSYKLLGSALGKRSAVAGDAVASGGGGGAGGSGGGGSSVKASSAGGGGGGGGGGSGKSTVGAKMGVSGVGGAGAGGESGGGAGAGGTGAGGAGGGTGAQGGSGRGGGGGGDITEGFTTKRWFAVGLLFAGLLGLGYVLFSVRRAKTEAAANAARGRAPRAR